MTLRIVYMDDSFLVVSDESENKYCKLFFVGLFF
jgi:hypothetical protein